MKPTPLEKAQTESAQRWKSYEERVSALEKDVAEITQQLKELAKKKPYLWEGHDVP